MKTLRVLPSLPAQAEEAVTIRLEDTKRHMILRADECIILSVDRTEGDVQIYLGDICRHLGVREDEVQLFAQSREFKFVSVNGR